jgi:hypothetical protein
VEASKNVKIPATGLETWSRKTLPLVDDGCGLRAEAMGTADEEVGLWGGGGEKAGKRSQAGFQSAPGRD